MRKLLLVWFIALLLAMSGCSHSQVANRGEEGPFPTESAKEVPVNSKVESETLVANVDIDPSSSIDSPIVRYRIVKKHGIRPAPEEKPVSQTKKNKTQSKTKKKSQVGKRRKNVRNSSF